MASVDRINGLTGNLGIKAPVRCATTANITLSGLQTIDGITVAAGDRVLVKNQTAQTDNGIYAAKSTSWVREPDFDGNRDITTGTLVFVREGTANTNSLYKVTSTNPIIIGTSNITFAIGEFSAAAAEAAQLAAEAAQAAAETAETNAETAASTATTQAGIATTQAGNSASSASTATTQAGIATTQAGLASGYATSASVFASANIRWVFDNSTTMADPGTGKIRFNNSTLSSVTAIALAETNADSADMATWITGFDDASHSPRGYLTIKKNATNFVVFGVTGANTDNGSWQQLTVTHQARLGSFSNGDNLYLDFTANGSDGTGTGDVVGPASAIDGRVALFDGSSGKLLKVGTGTGSGTITALTGDVTASGSGSVAATIANDAVTYAKIQNVSAASKLLGRGDSGSGDVQEITLGTGLSMSGTTLSASGSGGNIQRQLFTTSGTFTTPASSNINTVYKITAVGGGAGGGGASATNFAFGGGGSSGSTGVLYTNGYAANTAISVTVGAGGSGGNSAGSNGTAGNPSFITIPGGATFGGNGGTAGQGSTATSPSCGVVANASPNRYGTLSSDYSLCGGNGEGGICIASGIGKSGSGGSSFFGIGARGEVIASDGSYYGNNWGTGGSGAAAFGTGRVGGNGCGGAVLIEWIG